ncbi:glycosyltransferase family 2 protein [Acidomonas methanolica]|uniref:Glycosyl transferase n=1 Tax=Acidomonas methanolica NBRC 104435 TaxID=1231351 RepID=A0A023D7V9_ACIMT|nr:glycosyltransferase family 2 protein [Acidomonas methanolica]MBU2653795.1 glycosyltransferase family 2 protein [Acidomonas methanolica]GAJ30213.1 glycosyl transferase [Acidomonas methanolica NBRC 104435]GBQ51461.1 glycosyltransferase [Acidomonas methanolica]GEK98165.1 hypothetical protein AME01nite_06640 [Acidomonas methanolica NBRC 104435]
MMSACRHVVLMPSYNSGPLLLETVVGVLRAWPDVIVVIDGSTDGSDATLASLLPGNPGLEIVRRVRNGGKGSAVLAGALRASARGFTHVLTMDADGQHPPEAIRGFIERSRAHPGAMILGAPVFGADAPVVRVWGRKIANGLARLKTAGAVRDCLFGFRVYPLADLLAVMRPSRFMKGFDFDPELAVRLCWRGVPAINVPTVVHYLSRAEGGISHFRYGRDNLRLGFMYLHLGGTWVWRSVRSHHGMPPRSF